MDKTKYTVQIHEICRTLACTYGNPQHGNKSDPLDELIYIILSIRTHDLMYRTVFNELKQSYPYWDKISASEISQVEAILRPAGLATRKAHQIVAILNQLHATFGCATLAPLKDMGDQEAETFLTSLPGVGIKVAKCVLLYALGRQVLPVDTHVYRVASRLGFRTKGRPDTSQYVIEWAVPPDLRYSFHVNAIEHGRRICLPSNPRCQECCISEWCKYYTTFQNRAESESLANASHCVKNRGRER